MGKPNPQNLNPCNSEIDKIGAGMYKGENITVEERHKKGVAELKGKH